MNSSLWNKFHHKLWTSKYSNIKRRLSDSLIQLFVLLLDEFKVVMVVDQGYSHSDNHFSKSFTQTDALTSEERDKTHRASLLTVRSLEVRRVWIESLRNKLAWLLPLFRVMLYMIDIDVEYLSFFNKNITTLFVFSESIWTCHRDWGIDPQRLIKAIS